MPSKFNPKKIMIMKKTYVHPEFEIFEVETTGSILQGSVIMGGDDNRAGAGFEELSNKRQPAGPWDNAAPWE